VTIWRPDFTFGEAGASAAEFALVVPVFFASVMAVLDLGIVLWAFTTLQYAVDDAARCAVVKTHICTDPTTTQNYAASHYMGPNISPVFTASGGGGSNPRCGLGWRVAATARVPLSTGLFNITVPLSATACFP